MAPPQGGAHCYAAVRTVTMATFSDCSAQKEVPIMPTNIMLTGNLQGPGGH